MSHVSDEDRAGMTPVECPTCDTALFRDDSTPSHDVDIAAH